MSVLLLVLAFVIGALTITAVFGVARGPTVIDRLLSSSFGAVSSVVLLMLIGFIFGRPELFIDIGLSYALLAFLFPLAFARYLEARRSSGRPAEPETPRRTP